MTANYFDCSLAGWNRLGWLGLSCSASHCLEMLKKSCNFASDLTRHVASPSYSECAKREASSLELQSAFSA